jgi:ubiquinone/menaquinone biosynthesis C-methylase UbiE
VLDVGCGPGALTERLAELAGGDRVSAGDPSESFVNACSGRVPGADVRRAAAEELPWDDDAFDAALSQLVMNFMRDPERGASEMSRVVRPGGAVAACTWDYAGGMEMLRLFWDAAKQLNRDAPDEGERMRQRTTGELDELWRATGFDEVETAHLMVEQTYADFDELWEPFTFGIGPAGTYCASLEPEAREALRDETLRRLGSPAGPFTLRAKACAVRGSVPSG